MKQASPGPNAGPAAPGGAPPTEDVCPPDLSSAPHDGADARRARALRAAAHVAVAAALVVAVVQFQVGTMRALHRAEEFDRRHPDWTPRLRKATGLLRPSADKGAIGRWRRAVRQLWAGRNIYEMVPPNYAEIHTQPVSSVDSPAHYGAEYMHPNSPMVVLLLTPLVYLPVWAMALSFNVLKLAALAAAVAFSAAVAAHHGRRIVGWVVLLGLLWALMPVIGDIQHGNTNVFALAAIAAHVWLFRRGRDGLAGLLLAAAILIKMTPALFLLYWLYQRSGKLLAATLAALVLLGAVLPAAALAADEGSAAAGLQRYAALAGAWLDHMILPGLMKGSWYPEHINQSLSGVLSRYFLSGPNGDIYWGPDDDPHYVTALHGWITLVDLPEGAVRGLLRAGQLAVLSLAAWAIGWRKLPRDDGRRALHYALVLLAMMLLNQRTWDHHSAVLVPAGVAVWHAIAFGRLSRGARLAALGLAVGAGLCTWLDRSELFEALAGLWGHTGPAAERWSDTARAYGPTFYHFLLLFAAAVILAAALRRRQDPYAPRRQTLREQNP